MDFTATYSGFVIGAYALSATMLTGLVIFILARDRVLRTEMERKDQP